MNHHDTPRPDARQIIDTIAEAMRAGTERIDDELILVPASFEVFLHGQVFEELEQIFPIIRERAQVRLDREMERLNQGGMIDWALRLVNAEHTPMQFRRAGRSWDVQIYPSHDASIDRDYIAVAAELVSDVAQATAGPKTRRLTMRDSAGGFHTRILDEDESIPREPAKRETGRTTSRGREERVGDGGEPLARLSFTDDSGARTVLLTAIETAIGRRDDDFEWVAVQLDTLDDVSREHVRLRYDTETDSFSIKDLSSFGTSVAVPDDPESKHRIASSVDPETGRDLDQWEPLPRHAVIGLADVIFLDFESLH